MKKEFLDMLIKLGNDNKSLRKDIKVIYKAAMASTPKSKTSGKPVIMAELKVQTSSYGVCTLQLAASPGTAPYFILSSKGITYSLESLPFKGGWNSSTKGAKRLNSLKYNSSATTEDYLDVLYDLIDDSKILSKKILTFGPPEAWFPTASKFASPKDELLHLRKTVAAFYKKLADLDPSFIKQFEIATQLSKVDPELAKVMSEDGDGKQDKVSVSKATMSASALKPSQTTMVLAKSLGMALGMLETGKIGGDLGAIVSNDGYIMDGHHRWSAAILAGGKSAKVGGYKADLKGDELVRALNILTKGYFKVNKGNPGKGALADYTPAKVKAMLLELVEKGVPGEFPKSADDVKKILEDNFGSVEDGVTAISNNAKFITTKTPSWAPDRVDMPVINPEQVPAAAKKLQQGEVIIPTNR
jgi:hypothetical protein